VDEPQWRWYLLTAGEFHICSHPLEPQARVTVEQFERDVENCVLRKATKAGRKNCKHGK
jgi:hypothetical protein